MFLTGMAANPMVAQAAQAVFGVTFDWGTWALGSVVPGLVGLALLPTFIFLLAKPTLTDTRAAQAVARRELEEMGRWSRGEKIMGGVGDWTDLVEDAWLVVVGVLATSGYRTHTLLFFRVTTPRIAPAN